MHVKKHDLRDIEEEIMEVLFDITIIKKENQRIKMGEILDKIGQELAKTQLTNIVRRKLEPQGFVDYTPYDGILLTDQGFQVAKRIARNHRLAEAMLSQIFNVPFKELHEQACNIEHGISDRLAVLIFQKLKEKKTPFGDIIPMGEVEDSGCDNKSLTEIPVGKKVVLTKINNHTADTAEELEYYDIHGIGVVMTIKERDKEKITVILNKTEQKIPLRVSRILCVREEE
ncbi:MAG: metal-dependent transcriptional regulator [Promethearchaeota archaeon]